MPPHVVVPLGDGAFLVTHENGTVTRAWAAAHEDVVWVFIEGRVYRAGAHPDRVSSAVANTPSHDEVDLSAPMPATVSAVHVTPGDQVAEGDVLITLEAMKMELSIRAPRAGMVTAVRCRAGDLVQPGAPLVDLA
jgi:3-methylcrotonyl-CoA carboxylase alpha subunit